MRNVSRALRSLLLSAIALCPGAAFAQPHDHTAALGTVNFPVSCTPAAQTEFTRAVALLHHMTYPEARQAFERVATLDANCAMAHWGIAMTLFQPLWPTRPGPADLQRGWSEVQKAQAVTGTSDRERAFIASTAAFFRDPASTDYWARVRHWEEAMATAFKATPTDHEVAAFYALAHLAITPADAITRANADRAAEILMRVYQANPDHPGVMHYLVHANDVPGRERELLDITRRYDALAPRNPHALHMPTHIYTRLGDWPEVIRGNLAAASAALEHPAGPKGEYVWDEFPHAIEYLVYASLQQGDDDAAAAQIKRMRETANLEPTFKTAFHLASSAARYTLERRAWQEAAALVPRMPANLNWDRFTWPDAITEFARGLGAARTGNLDAARNAATRLEQLHAATAKAGEDLFARNIKVLHLEVRAWLAHASGDKAESVSLMREAATLEAATPKHAVTPAPTLPADELLGDLLMEQQQPRDALAAYQRANALYPRRFNTLLGLARAAESAGDQAAARRYYDELRVSAGRTSRR